MKRSCDKRTCVLHETFNDAGKILVEREHRYDYEEHRNLAVLESTGRGIDVMQRIERRAAFLLLQVRGASYAVSPLVIIH